MDLKAIYVSWFDLLAVIVLLWGIRSGRKRGMSQECLGLFQWITIVLVAGFGYEALGVMIHHYAPFSPFFSFLSAYLLLALLAKLLFMALGKSLGEKLAEREAFGNGEYYFGMLAGGVRWLCMLLVGLSLLHAREYTQAERQARATVWEKNVGSEFLPSIADVQDEVFGRSWVGQYVEKYGSIILIRPSNNEPGELRRAGVVRARERAVYDVLENR